MIDYDNGIVGKQIRYYRTLRNISQKELAKSVGVSAAYIAELENGGNSTNSSVSMKNICKIADVLNVTLDILADTNIEYPKNTTRNKTIDDIQNALDCLHPENLILFNDLSAILADKNKKV